MSKRFLSNNSQQKKGRPVPTLRPRKMDRETDEALSSRYDALNHQFLEIEKRFRKLKSPSWVWVDYDHAAVDPRRADSPMQWKLLGWCKVNGKWQLYHAYDCEGSHDPNHETFDDFRPLIECPVDVRVNAAMVVRKLHDAILTAKKEYVPKVDEAISELSELCNEI